MTPADDIPPFIPKDDKAPTGRASAPKARTGRTKGGKPTQFLLSLDQLEETLDELLVGGGLALFSLGLARNNDAVNRDGIIIIGAHEELTASIMTMARRNPYVRNVLDKALSGGGLLTEIGPLLLVAGVIAANHGYVPTAAAPMAQARYKQYEAKAWETISSLETDIAEPDADNSADDTTANAS